MKFNKTKYKKRIYEENKIKFTTFWQLLITLIIIAVIVGIPWFMISVVGLLKKIESKLESLEKDN